MSKVFETPEFCVKQIQLLQGKRIRQEQALAQTNELIAHWEKNLRDAQAPRVETSKKSS